MSELMTYQAAAEIAGCSAPALVKAVRAGTLKYREGNGGTGFDRDEVLIWSYSRGFKLTSEDVGLGVSKIQNFWTHQVPTMTMNFMRSPNEAEDVYVKFIKDVVYQDYVFNVLQMDANLRYSFSECHVMRTMVEYNKKMFNSEVTPRERKDIEIRFLYCLYCLIKKNLFYLLDEFQRLK